MRRFTAFVKKEFYHILRDPRTLMILIGMPVVQILLFGYAINNELKNAPIAILDLSADERSHQLTSKVLASDYFSLSDRIYSEKEIEEVFKDGITKAVLVFSSDFSHHMSSEGKAKVQIVADATDPNTATSIINYINAIIADYNRGNNLSQMPLTINSEVRMRYNPELNSSYYFVPGIIVVLLMLISAMMTSISIAREKELGTMEVLLASPMAPLQIILAKVVPYMLLSFFDAMLILVLGKFVFGVPILGNIGLLLFVIIIFILLALALGILISTVANTQQTALLMSMMGLLLPTILLSGFIFPVENMPFLLRMISNIIPAKWCIITLKDIMLKGVGITMVLKEVLIMIVFLVVFVLLSIKKFNVRLS